MKTLVTFILLSLICFLCNSPAAAAPHAPTIVKQQCCPNTTQFRISHERVKEVIHQRDCSLKGILVTTVCDFKICLDGNWPHAQNLLKKFQKLGPSKAKCTRNV